MNGNVTALLRSSKGFQLNTLSTAPIITFLKNLPVFLAKLEIGFLSASHNPALISDSLIRCLPSPSQTGPLISSVDFIFFSNLGSANKPLSQSDSSIKGSPNGILSDGVSLYTAHCLLVIAPAQKLNGIVAIFLAPVQAIPLKLLILSHLLAKNPLDFSLALANLSSVASQKSPALPLSALRRSLPSP